MADIDESLITKAIIVNWARVELGLSGNFSIDDATKMGALVDIFWPRCVARCFGLYEWTFCRKTFLLTRQDETPVVGYAYGFDLPGGILGEPFKYLSNPRDESPVRDVRIEARTVFADEAVLYAACKVYVDPQYWDLTFTDVFAVALASYLAVPLTQDIDLQEAKEKAAFGTPSEGGAGGRFGRLIAANRSAHPLGSPQSRHDVLSDGRGSWFGRW